MSGGSGTFGKYLLILGVAIAIVGILLIVLERFPGFRIGRLPGDIYIERDGWRFYFPLMTSLLVSIILSLIFWLIRRR